MNTMFSSSIRKRFTFGLVLIITSIMVIFTVVLILVNARSIEKDLEKKLFNLTALSKESLASALWQYNYDYIKDYVASLHLYEDLVYASVEGNETTILEKVNPALQNMSYEDLQKSENFITSETEVSFKNVYVGTVRLALSRSRISNLVWTTSTQTIAQLFVVNLAIFATIFIFTRWYIFKPLAHLQKSVIKVSTGDLDAKIDTSSDDEIGQLAKSFQQMLSNLKAITASRNDLNREIQVRESVEKELINSLNEKEVLLREVHHRVKNNLQMIQSLLSLQLSQFSSSEVEAVAPINDAMARITSITMVHEYLYQSENLSVIDLSDYLQNLIDSLVRSLQSSEYSVEVEYKINQIQLTLDKVISCGLIINELVTNSLKYAFTPGMKGKIKVSLFEEENNLTVLTVSDNGIGIDDFDTIKEKGRLGLDLVHILAENQLDGDIEMKNQQGLQCIIRFYP